jgi:SagB-type dehydrogenase family enzyme
MRARHLVAVALAATLVAGCVRAAPEEMLSERFTFTEATALPTPRTTGAMSLEEAIAARRSGRDFRRQPLPMWLVGQLLWAAQGVTGPDGRRAAPSAGALYPLELYVVEPSAVLHYLPQGHRIERRADVDRRGELQAAAFGQSFVGSAPLIVIVAAVFERTRQKYGAVADDLVNREAGHAAENILLEATAQGLAAVPVGGFDPRAVELAVALPPGCDALYLIPVGYPADAAG